MKKRILVFSLFLLLGSSACSHEVSPVLSSGFTEQLSSTELNTLDDLIDYSTNIVKAELISVEEFDPYTSVYSFSVEKDYTGNTQTDIHVYDLYDDRWRLGASYYLFLECYESALYPHPIYTTIAKGLILDAGSFQKASVPDGTLSISPQAVPASVENAVKAGRAGTKAAPSAPLSSASNVQALSSDADLILAVRISQERQENPYVSSYTPEVLSILKGPSGYEPPLSILLPPHLEPDTTYYLFMTEDPAVPGSYALASRRFPAADASSLDPAILSLD